MQGTEPGRQEYAPWGNVQETLPFNYHLQDRLTRYVEAYDALVDGWEDATGHERRALFRSAWSRGKRFVDYARALSRSVDGGLLQEEMKRLRRKMKEQRSPLLRTRLLDVAVVLSVEWLYENGFLIATKSKHTGDWDVRPNGGSG